jgi:O-antigen/teichoic acid export membrane protein
MAVNDERVVNYKPDEIGKLLRAARQAGPGAASFVLGFLLVLGVATVALSRDTSAWLVVVLVVAGIALMAVGLFLWVREIKRVEQQRQRGKEGARSRLADIKPLDPNKTTLP